MRTLASYISRRSAAIVAASLFALWKVKAEAESDLLSNLAPNSPFSGAARAEVDLTRSMTAVAFNGSVIECYPGYQKQLQTCLDSLLSAPAEVAAAAAAHGSFASPRSSIDLVFAKESSLLGAAVALASLDAKTHHHNGGSDGGSSSSSTAVITPGSLAI